MASPWLLIKAAGKSVGWGMVVLVVVCMLFCIAALLCCLLG